GRAGIRGSERGRGGVHWLSFDRVADGRWSGPRRGTPDARLAMPESPSPVRTTPQGTTSASAPEDLTLLIGKDRGKARPDDLVAEPLGQVLGLQHDVPEITRREEAGQRVEPEQATADRLVADLRIEADECLVDAVEYAQRRGGPLLERAREMQDAGVVGETADDDLRAERIEKLLPGCVDDEARIREALPEADRGVMEVDRERLRPAVLAEVVGVDRLALLLAVRVVAAAAEAERKCRHDHEREHRSSPRDPRGSRRCA